MLYCPSESNGFQNIQRDDYVSNNNKTLLQASIMLSDLDMGSCGIGDLKGMGVRTRDAVFLTVYFSWIL